MTYTTEETTEKNSAKRVITLYNLLEDAINRGSIVGIAMWADDLMNCVVHIEVDNKNLFKK